jgi:hypothetical protein
MYKKMKSKKVVLTLIVVITLSVTINNAAADAVPDANPGPKPDAKPGPKPEPESQPDPEAKPKFVSDDGIIFDDDAIILVSPIQKNPENRSPRQYRGQPAQQRTASGSSQTAKDLVSGK